MHKITAILASLALVAPASAGPRRHARRAPSPAKLASQQWVRDCVHERTGPTDGLSVTVATRLCKAMSRIHDAIEACEQAVSDACVDQCTDTANGCDCTDDAIAAEFALCFPRQDAPVGGKGGK
jgi:hypothetical protein